MEQETTAIDADTHADVDVDTDDTSTGSDPDVVDELLVEEISIDGMCGVY